MHLSLETLSKFAKDLIAEYADDTPIQWLHQKKRTLWWETGNTGCGRTWSAILSYPPIWLNLKLSFVDEKVIHYGIIPLEVTGAFCDQWITRPAGEDTGCNCLIFCRKATSRSVALSWWMPLIFYLYLTANLRRLSTNRGSIVTPLKRPDREPGY